MPTAGQRVRAGDFPPTVSVSDNTLLTNVPTSPTVGSPAVSTTFTAATSGKALITVSGLTRCTSSLQPVIIDWELYLGTSAGGTLILGTGQQTRRLEIVSTGAAGNGYGHNLSKTYVATGLVAGSTYFIRTMHYSFATATGDVGLRQLSVTPAF